MKAGEALALIDELTEIAMDDTRATKRAGRERQNDLERAREICTKLESAPGVPELVRERSVRFLLGSSVVQGHRRY
jgi:hypothetical protein